MAASAADDHRSTSSNAHNGAMKPLRFLFVSSEGSMSDVAWQVLQEGHEVRFHVENHKEDGDVGDGFVTKVEKWRPSVRWADVIVFDDTLGHGKLAQRLRANGKKVIGGTPYTDRLEDDREFGQQELKRHGVSILSQVTFSDYSEAIEYIRRHPDQYVIKPSGEAQNTKRLLFIGEESDGSDVIRVLESYSRVWNKYMKTFQLQERVRGVEVAVGAFFNGHRFLEPINVNFEHKRFFSGDIGPMTGEMGTTMFWSDPNEIFTGTLRKLEPRLAAERFVGYIDINCIVNGSGIFPLELTPRFGFPTIFIQTESLAMPTAEFLYRLAAGEDFRIKTKRGYHIGVRVVVPPFPFRGDRRTFETYSKNATIVFRRSQTLEGVHIEDVKLVNGVWAIAGTTGVALVVTGSGSTMPQAQEQVYERIQNILIPNKYYRTDIGDRWREDIDHLHTWGYLRR